MSLGRTVLIRNQKEDNDSSAMIAGGFNDPLRLLEQNPDHLARWFVVPKLLQVAYDH